MREKQWLSEGFEDNPKFGECFQIWVHCRIFSDRSETAQVARRAV